MSTDNGFRKRKADQCLAILRAGPTSSGELIEKLGHRFSTCIDQLRQRGYQIDVTENTDGSWTHTLVASPEKERGKVTPDMKEAYYLSEHWQRVRADRLSFDHHRCCLCQCPSPPLQVHHWRYKLFAEARNDLATLCAGCHEEIHETPNILIHFPHYVDLEIATQLKALIADEPEEHEPVVPRDSLFDGVVGYGPYGRGER